MATGAKMNYNFYQNGKHGTLPQNTNNMEVTQDMHLKMSKKIAQLTKVIYALNTKNDEHEAVVQAIKDQHEEQQQQLLAETKQKLEYYKQKISSDVESNTAVQQLQKCIHQQEDEKKKAQEEFETYKKDAEEKELQLQSKHASTMLSMSQEVLTMKKEFEAKLFSIDSIREQLEKEKQQALQEMSERHKQELADLEALQKKGEDLEAAKAELEHKYKNEMENLSRNLERLENEKLKMIEDHESKMAKAQAFFEKELEVLKHSQNATANEQLTMLQDSYDKLKKDFSFSEAQSKKRIDDLLQQMAMKEEDLQKYKDDLHNLQEAMKNNDSSSDLLRKQYEEAKQQVSEAITKLKEVEGELIATKQRCEHQAKDLLTKSTEIGELEATRLQNEALIKDLQSQLGKAKDRSQWLESSKRALESQKELQADETSSQVKSLEKALEEMSIEKEKMKEKYERELSSLDSSSKQEIKKLTEKHLAEMEALNKRHKDETTTLLKEADIKFGGMKQDLEAQMDAERRKLITEKEAINSEYERVKAELSSKLARAEEEVRRLQKIVDDREQGLGSATSNLNSLRDAHDRVKSELDQTRNELRSSRSKASSLQAEYDKLKLQHESKMKEAQQELKTKLDQLSKDLDNKWSDTLRNECMKLRQELSEQRDADKHASINQLNKMKQEEIAALKQGWENKLAQLMEQISTLQSQLESQGHTKDEEMHKLKLEAEAENRRLLQEMLSAANDYAKKIGDLETMYKGQLKSMEDKKNVEKKEMEQKLKEKHIEDMQAQMTAHRATISALQDQADRAKEAEVKTVREKHKQQLDTMTTELEHRHGLEMEEINQGHSEQMMAARMELERAIEITKQKEAEHAMKISDVEEEIRHRSITIGNLEDDIRRLQKGVNDMSKELEAKGKEVLKIRSEANKEARLREEQLLEAHKDEIANIHTDSQREREGMLDEFSEAQEMLKDKIAQLQLMLEEAEERYNRRDSRPEDLKIIQQLQDAVRERDYTMKKMEDDKRYFQMELINRETNFNKVFNSDPKIGVMNPLNVGKKKKGDKRGSLPNQSPSMPSFNRLNPIAGSPIHDEKFNPTRPLPPTKKFVS